MKVFKVETGFGTPTIREVECVKVSDKSIFFENNHVLRESWHCNYLESYNEAATYSIELAKKAIENAEMKIISANSTIKQYKDFITNTKEQA